jgi:hypothetical protein
MELQGINGIRNYTAIVEMATAHREPDTADPPPGGGAAWPWSVEEVYENYLFHGPDFQVLRSLEILSSQGGSVTLWGTPDVDWGKGPWLTNPAALDGGMQLALLWALHHKGRKSLPTSVGAFIPYSMTCPTAPLRCELRVRASARHEVVGDLLFRDREDRPVAELRQLSMTLLQPSKDKVVA